MFWKKSQPQQPAQSQQSGGSVTNSQISMTQAGSDATSSQAGNLANQQQGITGADVVKLLEEMEAVVKVSGVYGDTQQKILNSVGAAKDEAQRKDADRDLVAKNLKRAGEAIESVDKATDAGKNLWQKGHDIFGAIAPWLGTAAKLLRF